MTQITKIEDHYERAKERLPTQFKEKHNIDALVQSWFSQIQALEDTLIDIREKTKLLEAEGEQLDRYAAYYNIIRSYNETDDQLFGRIAKEIIGRASEASPDSLRHAVEAITGLKNTNVIEFSNVVEWENNSVSLREGAVLVFGYYQDSRERIDGVISNVIEKAIQIAGGTTIFGKHLNVGANNSLWIPCEITTAGERILLREAGDVTSYLVDSLGDNLIVKSNNLKTYGKNWELGVLPEDDIVLSELQVAPSGDNLQVFYEGNPTPDNLFTGVSGLELQGHLLEIVQTVKQQ